MPGLSRRERVRAIAEQLAARRARGRAVRRRKRLPRQLTPKGIIRDYTRELLAVVKLTQQELQPLLDELPALLKSAAADRVDSARADAGEGRRIRELVARAREGMKQRLNQRQLDDLLDTFADRTATFNRAQLNKQIRAALGADVFVADTGLSAVVDAFAAENSQLIVSLPEQLLGDVEAMTNRAVRSATTHRELMRSMEDRFRISRNRARLIARDQVSTLYSQINRTRQQNAGATHYIWRTVNDERVRDEHEGLEGETFSWKSGHPTEGHPGEPIQCRCYAEPIFDPELLA